MPFKWIRQLLRSFQESCRAFWSDLGDALDRSAEQERRIVQEMTPEQRSLYWAEKDRRNLQLF